MTTPHTCPRHATPHTCTSSWVRAHVSCEVRPLPHHVQVRIAAARSAARQLAGTAGDALDPAPLSAADVRQVTAGLNRLGVALRCPLRDAALAALAALQTWLLRRERAGDQHAALLLCGFEEALPLLDRPQLPPGWASPPAEHDASVWLEQQRCAQLAADGRNVVLLWPCGLGKSTIALLLAQWGHTVMVVSPLSSVRAPVAHMQHCEPHLLAPAHRAESPYTHPHPLALLHAVGRGRSRRRGSARRRSHVVRSRTCLQRPGG